MVSIFRGVFRQGVHVAQFARLRALLLQDLPTDLQIGSLSLVNTSGRPLRGLYLPSRLYAYLYRRSLGFSAYHLRIVRQFGKHSHLRLLRRCAQDADSASAESEEFY